MIKQNTLKKKVLTKMKICENKQYGKRKIIATFEAIIKNIDNKNKIKRSQDSIFVCNKSCNYGYQMPVSVGKTDYTTCIANGTIDEKSIYQISRKKS